MVLHAWTTYSDMGNLLVIGEVAIVSFSVFGLLYSYTPIGVSLWT